MRSGIPLGAIGGVQIVAHWSLLIIFMLVLLSLGGGALPQWHPEWSAGLVWSTALAAALLFFASVLAHELSHALVGRRSGIRIPRITLFVFGGMAHMESEPPDWRSELRMAAVGPITSLAIGAVCLWLGAVFAPAVTASAVQSGAGAEVLLRNLGPTATVLYWLGTINIVLGIFNLVPGFPLDGGRVLRALAWGVTGDFARATRAASLLGQGVAWALMALGVAMLFGMSVPVFGQGAGSGLWLILIGWFLNNAALLSYRQMELSEALADIPVQRLMQTSVVRVAPDLTVGELADRHLVASGQRAFVVERDGRLEGLVSISDLRRSERSTWSDLQVQKVMTPAKQLATVAPRQRASLALEMLARRGVKQLPVVENAQVVGMVTHEGLVRWLSFQQHAAPHMPSAGHGARG